MQEFKKHKPTHSSGKDTRWIIIDRIRSEINFRLRKEQAGYS